MLQLVYYGDLVIPTPSWVSYAPQAHIIGRHVNWLQTLPEQGFTGIMIGNELLDAVASAAGDGGGGGGGTPAAGGGPLGAAACGTLGGAAGGVAAGAVAGAVARVVLGPHHVLPDRAAREPRKTLGGAVERCDPEAAVDGHHAV